MLMEVCMSDFRSPGPPVQSPRAALLWWRAPAPQRGGRLPCVQGSHKFVRVTGLHFSQVAPMYPGVEVDMPELAIPIVALTKPVEEAGPSRMASGCRSPGVTGTVFTTLNEKGRGAGTTRLLLLRASHVSQRWRDDTSAALVFYRRARAPHGRRASKLRLRGSTFVGRSDGRNGPRRRRATQPWPSRTFGRAGGLRAVDGDVGSCCAAQGLNRIGLPCSSHPSLLVALLFSTSLV